ncbi:hypothetical protein FACS1894174_01260 [Bacteroidia bacterium]|nr:hypothetical protein FACS1894203_2130 [Bacteroidia bacterium]GHV20088.1 hypothetical protein FACS1894174_01260 [Bacteroidia bacterium]
MNKFNKIILLACIPFLFSCHTKEDKGSNEKLNISGIYPHLAYFNDEVSECGTGAVVPWAGSLWAITYGAHFPFGSSDKLYQITPDLEQIIREESIGGTPANRMIHKESNQLFIGPYAIDKDGGVRAIPYSVMPGRHTGNARHLSDPVNKIYYGTMEEGFYEVDVKTLDVKLLYVDGNVVRKEGSMAQFSPLLAGVHGKGLYSGQGVMVYSNNGEDTQEALSKFNVESGSLSEWDGKDWKLIRRNQFVEVTGPGGIYGNPHPETDPIWVTGWDYKSVLLGVRDAVKGWTFYRLPKASHSYDGAHGWNTEWPRIRDIGTPEQPEYLMTMHGMFWHFPETFTASNTAGIRPRSAYLKVIGDFTRWDDRLVFGCDDSAQKEFLNKRKAKGNIEGPGQSQSNLWFTAVDMPGKLGPRTAAGYVWLNESIPANAVSEPFLFTGWDTRSAWAKNSGSQTVDFLFEVDQKGNGQWTELKKVSVAPGKTELIGFDQVKEQGEWVRVKANVATTASISFVYGANDTRSLRPDAIYKGISTIDTNQPSIGGLLYGLGKNRKALGVLANSSETGETGYYEVDEQMHIVKKEDPETADFIREKFAIPQQAVEIESGSVLVVDDAGRRWRLPLGNDHYTEATRKATLRICREVATERDMFNCHGTFYELPAENADGYAKIRPIASHNLKINDYASYRGMLILTGINPNQASGNSHIFVSDDKKAAIWAGVIDDLWKLGKPVGLGGPWKDSSVKLGIPSDPYLIGFYDKKTLTLSHQDKNEIHVTVEVDPTGDGDWVNYAVFTVKSNEKFTHQFSNTFKARWIRFTSDTETKATAWLEYK